MFINKMVLPVIVVSILVGCSGGGGSGGGDERVPTGQIAGVNTKSLVAEALLGQTNALDKAGNKGAQSPPPGNGEKARFLTATTAALTLAPEDCAISGTQQFIIDGEQWTIIYDRCVDEKDVEDSGEMILTLYEFVECSAETNGRFVSDLEFIDLTTVENGESTTMNVKGYIDDTESDSNKDGTCESSNTIFDIESMRVQSGDEAIVLSDFHAELYENSETGEYKDNYRGWMDSVAAQGTLYIETLEPMTGTYIWQNYDRQSGNPDSGKMEIRGADGSIIITVLSSDVASKEAVKVEVNEQTQFLSWLELESEFGILFGSGSSGGASAIPDLPDNAVELDETNASAADENTADISLLLFGFIVDPSGEFPSGDCVSAEGPSRMESLEGVTHYRFSDCTLTLSEQTYTMRGDLDLAFFLKYPNSNHYQFEGNLILESADVTRVYNSIFYQHDIIERGSGTETILSFSLSYSDNLLGGFVVTTQQPIIIPLEGDVKAGIVDIVGASSTRLELDIVNEVSTLTDSNGDSIQLP